MTNFLDHPVTDPLAVARKRVNILEHERRIFVEHIMTLRARLHEMEREVERLTFIVSNT